VSVNRVHANHDHNYQYHDEKRREKVIILSIEIKIDLNERNEIEVADTIKASVVYQTVTRSSTRIHTHISRLEIVKYERACSL
jgi:hypothetical protein